MLQHVTVEVSAESVPECTGFYGLLGFDRVDPPRGLRERAVWLQRAGTQIHLLPVADPQSLPDGHFAVVADDYPSTLAALERGGYVPEPRREHWGSPRAFVRDPAGNLVEVMAFPPG